LIKVIKIIRSYGIDAPNVVRNLFLFSLVAMIFVAVSFQIDKAFWFWAVFLYSSCLALCLFCAGCWMLYGIVIVKPKIVARLIDELDLKGNEKILDVGCGRGIFLIEMAKHLPNGQACAIDLWFLKDQSGNAIEKALANARAEQLNDRIEVQTADMQSLPYSNETFDVVVSSLSIHNIPSIHGRNKALGEILRVLKRGGRFVVLDIQHVKQYAAFINQTKEAEVTCSPCIYRYCPPLRILRGRKNTDSL